MDKAREFQKNISFSFIDYRKAFGCVHHNKLRNLLNEMGLSDHLISLEICMQDKKQQLEPYMVQLTGSKLGEEYDKAVYCHPAYLTSI